MKVQNYLVFLCMVLGVSAAAQAQTVTIPYEMSFEATGADATEMTNWVLNTGTQASACNDVWGVGTSVHSDGKQSLYITSTDTVTTPSYGSQANLQFAYRDFKLPAGSYYLSFDWMNEGAASAALYVGYVAYTNAGTGSVTYIKANSTSGVMPAVLANTNCSGALYGKNTWQSYTFGNTLNVSAGSTQTYRLYVAWANKGGSTDGATKFGGCVDNIQIVSSRVKRVTNITVTEVACDTIQLSWTGTADSYIVQYRQEGTSTWMTANYDDADGNTAMLAGLDEGNYAFRVRGIMYDDQGTAYYGAYSYYEGEYLVFCNDRHCLTYFDLDAPNVQCYYGKQSGRNRDSAPYQNTGKIDYGSDSKLSRHTVCWDQNATDPRTEDKLKLVPSGARASVRLGNWEYGAEAEAITYEMTVDSASCILMLRYAVVMEDPEHSEEAQPRFTIEICDANGQKIDPTCGYIDFTADATREGWHTVGSDYHKVTWKDWTTIGLHLGAYIGQTITVRLATFDCTQYGHYGYAYFVLDCAGATIESSSCGADTRFVAEAPSGFSYRWTTQDSTVVSTSSKLDVVSSDSIEYTCRLTNLEQADCWFELKVLALPRFPISDGKWSYQPVDCKNRVKFTNGSYVQTRYHGDVQNNYNTNLTGLKWDFGDGTDSEQPNPVHDFPATGGTYTVTLSTWLADQSTDCTDDTIFVVTVPAIGDTTMRDTVDICNGSYYEFGGNKYAVSGDYAYDGKSEAGCNVHYMCNLRVHETNETLLGDVKVCFGDVYCMNDSVCYLSGNKSGIFRHVFANQYGCDSVVIANVNYADEIVPVLDITQMSADVLEAEVKIGGTGYTYYTIDNGEKRTEGSYVTDEPGDYLFCFYNDWGCVDSVAVNLLSPCLRNRLFQRWNDIVAIYNNEYMKNHGEDSLVFVTYQWYEDDLPIEGATQSYYCAPQGLKMGAAYSCEVTLEDGSTTMICPLVAEDVVNGKSASVAPTAVPQGGQTNVYVPKAGKAVLYNALGHAILSESLSEGDNSLTLRSMEKGVYMLQVQQPDGNKVFRVTVQ